MSQEGGTSLTDIKSWTQNPIDNIVNAYSQYVTHGLVGYEEGRIKKGFMTSWGDEFVGELTGRNQAREMQKEQNKRLDEAQKQAELDRQNELLGKYNADVAASRSAQAIRNTAAARAGGGKSTGGTGASSAALGQDEKDLLGT